MLVLASPLSIVEMGMHVCWRQ